jgi:hypothetical protein
MFFFHDEPLPDDTRLVLKAAAKLDTTEFRLFELAYRDWYGRICKTSIMESYFTPYMFDNIVPFWVRAFCRKVMAFHGDSEKVQSAFGLRMLKATRGNKMFGFLYAATLVVCLVFLVYLFSVPADSLPEFLKECYFPPCY